MKKVIFAPILLFTLLFSGCSTTDGDSDSDPISEVSLEGKWEVVIYRIYEDGNLSETMTFSNDVFMEFKIDGRLILTQISENDETILNWKRISANRLLITEEGDSEEYEITVRNKNEVNLKQISGFPFDQFEFELKRK
jgi:hypothetical protein